MGSAELRWVRKRFRDAVSYRLRTVAGGRWAALSRPTWISFLLTERCNARCLHCDIWKNRGQEDSPTAEQWRDALADLRDWLGPAHVCLTGGEALLKPFAIDLLAYGAQIGHFMELLTHGYWKDQERIEQVALASPWRVTLSLDGLGEVHDRIRGRSGFFDKTQATIATLQRVRRERGLGFTIRLKTVIMSHNLDSLGDLARFATQDGVDVLFQPIEQNYNTPDDPEWFTESANWPRDTERAVAAIQELIALRRQGYAIANREAEFGAMIAYFRDPDAWRLSIQGHVALDRTQCSALGLFQAHSDGSVRVCPHADPIGNIKRSRPRDLWRGRPRWWEYGCCLEGRLTPAERERLGQLTSRT